MKVGSIVQVASNTNRYDECETHGKESMRDTVISIIIGYQNDKYWKTDSEGYKALQDVLEDIIDRYGDPYCPLYKHRSELK